MNTLICSFEPLKNYLRNCYPIILMFRHCINQFFRLILCPFVHYIIRYHILIVWVYMYVYRTFTINLVIIFLFHDFEILARQQRWQVGLFEVICRHNLWIVFLVEAILAQDVSTRQLLQSLMNRFVLLKLHECSLVFTRKGIGWSNLSIPLVVVTFSTTEVANWGIWCAYSLNLSCCNKV